MCPSHHDECPLVPSTLKVRGCTSLFMRNLPLDYGQQQTMDLIDGNLAFVFLFRNEKCEVLSSETKTCIHIHTWMHNQKNIHRPYIVWHNQLHNILLPEIKYMQSKLTVHCVLLTLGWTTVYVGTFYQDMKTKCFDILICWSPHSEHGEWKMAEAKDIEINMSLGGGNVV